MILLLQFSSVPTSKLNQAAMMMMSGQESSQIELLKDVSHSRLGNFSILTRFAIIDEFIFNHS